MPLEVETGTGKNNGETFVPEGEFVTFCDKRGMTITEDEASRHLIAGMDWINFLENEPGIKGYRTVEGQALPFPRTDLTIANHVILIDEIPQQVKYAQMFAAMASFNGVDLLPVVESGKILIEKETGPLKKKWALPDANASNAPLVPQALAYMGLLLADTGFKYNQRA